MKKNNESQPKSHAAPGRKHASAMTAAAKAERATGRVRAKASRDINGPSGMSNTGTNVSYEDKE